MENRPQIKITLSLFDKIIELAGVVFLLALWLLAIISYSSLPETIPIHYNAMGEVDNYGPKTSIFLLPIIGTLLFIILTVVNRHPENFNYPGKITIENAQLQYATAGRMIRFLKMTVMIVFLLIDIHTVQTANNASNIPGIWLMPSLVILILIPVAYFVYKSYKIKNS